MQPPKFHCTSRHASIASVVCTKLYVHTHPLSEAVWVTSTHSLFCQCRLSSLHKPLVVDVGAAALCVLMQLPTKHTD